MVSDRVVVRAIGVFCFLGAGLATLFWWHTDSKMAPLHKAVMLQPGKRITEPFLPILNESIGYEVALIFKRSPPFSISCDELKRLKLQWAVSESKDLTSWKSLAESSKDPAYFCGYDKNFTIAHLPPLSLQPHVKHYLHLASENKARLPLEVDVGLESGITVNYLFMDKAACELLGGFVLIVGLVCFLFDLCITIFKWQTWFD
ncbi:MAG: hypothetical protein ACAF41_12340 [Leptolyngbya sp. BL-A-14]